MKDTMPQFIADEHFLELFRFVVDLGAQAGPFIADLRSFHDKFVDPKVRKVRTSTFALFNMIPEQFSFTKVASVKHVYSCHPSRVQHGYCELFRRQLLKQILDDQKLREVMREGEDVLSFFHASCSQALAALAKADKTWFLGNLDRDIFTAVMGGYGGRTGDAPATTRQADLHLISEKFYVRLASLVEGNSAAALPPRSWKTGFLVAPALRRPGRSWRVKYSCSTSMASHCLRRTRRRARNRSTSSGRVFSRRRTWPLPPSRSALGHWCSQCCAAFSAASNPHPRAWRWT